MACKYCGDAKEVIIASGRGYNEAVSCPGCLSYIIFDLKNTLKTVLEELDKVPLDFGG